MESSKRLPMARRGIGTKGHEIRLLANHFIVTVRTSDGYFYHYSVAMWFENGHPIKAKGLRRKVIDKASELRGTSFAYDGDKSLFTVGSLSEKELQFTVVLEETSSRKNEGPDVPNEEDAERMRRQFQSRTIEVKITYATKFPMQAIANASRGQDSDNSREAFRILDIILRQNAAKQGCLIVRQSFFRDDPESRIVVGDGVQGCRGFHSSFRATQRGLSLNIDVSTTVLVKPGPVVDFLLENQKVQQPHLIDWTKAETMLKSLRIKVEDKDIEYKITGLSDDTCRTQKFLKKESGKDGNGEVQLKEITVYDYFTQKKKGFEPQKSADMPCIDVGKSKRPCYFPIELCSLVSLQRYTKVLTNFQRTKLVKNSTQSPQKRKASLEASFRSSRYGDDPMLSSSGITIDSNFTRITGRVLQPPKVVIGSRRSFFPQRGRWNFNKSRPVHKPVKIENWAIVNFSDQPYARELEYLLRECAENISIQLNAPSQVFEEDRRWKGYPGNVRVDEMYKIVKSKLSRRPQLLLCILPRNSHIYGPWKRRNLVVEGVRTQCIVVQEEYNRQCITNLLLKINAKLGGLNSVVEISDSIHSVSTVATLIIGMDVYHGPPGQSQMPSIAAVVSSRYWPSISRYRAVVRTQQPRTEIIESLFKPVHGTDKDDGIIRELLTDFHKTSGHKPEHIIIFRDGVSESQFNQVLDVELNQIIEACKHLDKKWNPKFTFIVAQKNHHTRFFQVKDNENVPPGTVIDDVICHPRNNDFYLCAHAGLIGTTRPTHYQVLRDDIGFSADNLQELVHSLCYVYQRSPTAVSLVTPVYYAHHAAAQMAQFLTPDELSQTSSSHVPDLPRLHQHVADSMFFC